MHRSRRGHHAVVAALATLLLVPGLALGQEAAEPDVDTETVPTAKLRLLVGHPHGTSDLYLDGEPVIEEIGFAQISEYVDVPAGERLLESIGSGMTLDDVRGRYDTGEFPNVAESVQQLQAGRAYTAALDQVQTGIELKLIADRPKPKAGQAQARVVSLCWACGPIGYKAAGQKQPLAKRLHYPEDKLAGKYVKVKPGTLDLVPRLEGAKQPLTDFDPVRIEPGTSHSLFVVGQDAALVALVPALDAAISSARFMSATREPTVADVFIDGKRAVKRIYPGRAAAKPVHLLAGEHLVQVVEAGTKPADGVLHEATVDFPAGAVAVEAVAGESLEAQPMPTSRAGKPRTTQIRFAHVDPEIPAVDIELRGMEPVLGLEPGEWTEYMTVPDGSSYAWIRPSANPADIYHEVPLDLGPRENVTAYVGGSPDIPSVDIVIERDPFAKSKKSR